MSKIARGVIEDFLGKPRDSSIKETDDNKESELNDVNERMRSGDVESDIYSCLQDSLDSLDKCKSISKRYTDRDFQATIIQAIGLVEDLQSQLMD